MKAEDLRSFHGKVFQIEGLENHFKQSHSSIKMQVFRLCKGGKLIRLKKNCYTLPDFHPNELLIAQQMVSPSYHSLEAVLSWNGIIPEGTASYTLVTSQKTQHYENDFGVFSYRHLSPELFFGVGQRQDGAWIASSEKALLDYFYLNSKKFKPDFACWQAERFDELHTLDFKKMMKWASKYPMKKVKKLVESLMDYAKSEEYQDHR